MSFIIHSSKIAHKFEVGNFLVQPQRTELPIISLEPKHNSKWIVKVDRQASIVFGKMNNTYSFTVTLQLLTPNEKPDATVLIYLVTSEGAENFHCMFQLRNTTIKPDGFVGTYSRLLNPDETNDCLQGRSLKLCVEFLFLENNNKPKSIEQNPETKLSDFLSGILDSKKHSDVTLIAGGQQFPVHKIILTARSEVFASMFEQNTRQKKINQVTIDDIEAEILQKVIHYMYTGQNPITDQSGDIVHKLLFAADKYALNDLKAMCDKAMSKELNIANATDKLVFADRHNLTQLKKKIIKFINCNRSDIIPTTGWKNIKANHPSLVVEVYEALADVINPVSDIKQKLLPVKLEK